MGRRFTIYCVTNRVNGKRYIGQTVSSLESRWKEHVKFAGQTRGCPALSAAIRKYGVAAFDREVLDVVTTQAGADIAERSWIGQRRTSAPHGYNLRLGGQHATFSDETRRKMSDSASRREARMTPAERSARRLGRSTPEERRAVALARWAAMTPEQRAEHSAKISSTLKASEKNRAGLAKAHAAMQTRTTEQRRESAIKSWVTRRARWGK